MVSPTSDQNTFKTRNTARPTPSGSDVHDFLAFKSWMTPKLVKILYVLGLIGVALGSLSQLVSGVGMLGGYSSSAGWGLVLSGIVTLVIGSLGVRVAAEMILVIFRIHESLEAQRKVAQCES